MPDNPNDDSLLQTLFRRAVDYPTHGVENDNRKAAIEFFQHFFGGPNLAPDPVPLPLKRLKRDYVSYQSQGEQPKLNTKDNPAAYDDGYADDSKGEMAALLAQRQYPNVMGQVGGIRVGKTNLGKQGEFNISGLTQQGLRGPAIVSMAPQETMGDSMNILRHELGHVRGLEDDMRELHDDRTKMYGTYDLGDVSNVLNKDIYLPTPPKR
jgi:hypothetical protein